MLCISGYDTTITRVLNVKEQARDIMTAVTQNLPWVKVNEENRTIEIYPNQLVRKFDHPLVIDVSSGRGVCYVATDLSAFVREEGEGNYHIANRSLYVLQKTRAGLTADMLVNGPRAIKSLPGAVIRTYSDLLTNAIAMAFHINPEEILRIRSLSAWLYFSMLSDQEEIGEMELQAVLAKMSRDINIPASFLHQVIDGKVFGGVEDYIDAIKASVPNPSINGLNLATFYTVIAKNLNSSIWVGLDKQQLMGAAVEHIPSFIAALLICLTEQPFKNTGLTKIALRNFTRDKQTFVLAVTGIVTGN